MAINSAQDNASVWAIAQGQRADVNGLAAVKSSLNRASSIADVASTAGASVSDLLNQVQAQVVSAQDPSLDASSRAAINTDFQSLLKQITDTINNAQFDGANLLNNSLPSGIQFLANAGATQFITLSSQDFSLGGALIAIPATSSLNTVASSAVVLTQIARSIANVNAALGNIGSQSQEITAQNTFVTNLSDVLNSGISNLVDADMAAESAQLQALQVRQQLGVQALSIANTAPQIILSLFK
jgi:flagellin